MVLFRLLTPDARHCWVDAERFILDPLSRTKAEFAFHASGQHFIGCFAYHLASKHWCIDVAVAGRGAVLPRGGGRVAFWYSGELGGPRRGRPCVHVTTFDGAAGGGGGQQLRGMGWLLSHCKMFPKESRPLGTRPV